MSQGCEYFQSDEWDARLEELENRVVTLKSTIWAADHIDDTENALDQLVDHLGVPRRELNERDVIETLSGVPDDVLEWNGKTMEDARKSMITVPESCPHEAVEDSDRCVFHMSPDRRTELDISDEDVRETFLEKVSERGGANKDFTGAKFGDLNLEKESLSAADNHPIRLSGCQIDGTLTMNDTVIDQPLVMSGGQVGAAEFIDAEFEKDVEFWGTDFTAKASFKYCIFNNDVEFWNCVFERDVSFYASNFHEYAEFRDAAFESGVLFKYAEVGRDVEFWDVYFGGYADFESMTIRNCAEFRYSTYTAEANFDSVKIDDRVEFRRADFGNDVSFEHFHVGGDCHFWGTEFEGRTHVRAADFNGYLEFKEGGLEGDGKSAVFHDDANFRYSSIGKDVEFWGVAFHGDADFRNVEFNGTTEFQHSRFEGDVDFSESTHTDIDFTDVAATDSEITMVENTIPEGTITQPADSDTYYDMTHANLGDLDLRAAENANIFDYYRFYETDFSMFPFPEYRRTLNKSWEIHEYGGDQTRSDFDKLESTYLKAKNGANDVGDSKAASEFFLRELRYQRKDHWKNFKESEHWWGKAENLFNWATNWTYNLTCGYGERPFRTVGFSLIIIVIFAIVYNVLEVSLESGNSFSEHITFSLQTFVALIVGGATPTNQTLAIQFLTALEAFFGAFAVALFVFSLTRSLHR